MERRDRHGNTPLHLACQMGDEECVKALTETIKNEEIKNANLPYSGFTQQVPQDFEERNYDGEFEKKISCRVTEFILCVQTMFSF